MANLQFRYVSQSVSEWVTMISARDASAYENHCQNIASLGKNIMFYMMVLVGLIPRSIIQDYDKNIIIQSKV